MGYINTIGEPSSDSFYIMDSNLIYYKSNEMILVYIPNKELHLLCRSFMKLLYMKYNHVYIR
jgi:hypothetical protein